MIVFGVYVVWYKPMQLNAIMNKYKIEQYGSQHMIGKMITKNKDKNKDVNWIEDGHAIIIRCNNVGIRIVNKSMNCRNMQNWRTIMIDA